jgi:hypothetical protein
MHKSLILILSMLAMVCLAKDETVPTRRIVSEDIVQDSVKFWQFSTNSFGVMWTYTEGGAKKFLAFQEAHEGKTVRTVIGGFESRPHVWTFTPNYISTNYAQWKEGWLKRRTDKVHGVSEDDAKKIMAGLKTK